MKLTNATVHKLALPAGKSDHIVFDEQLPGFGIRLRAGGSKTWFVQYRINGGQARLKIGTRDKVDADEARKRARKALGQVQDGIDPRIDRQESRDKAAETFESVGKLYLAGAEKRLRERSFEEVKRHIEKLWAPLAGKSIHHIDRRMVARRMTEMANENGPAAANRARASLSAMFGWAMREGIVEANPVIGTNKAAEGDSRERVLTDGELAEVWAASRNDDHGRIVRLLALTGQRREEVGGMRWSELDLERCVWCLPAERTKNGRPHVVPLATPAVAILRSAPLRSRLDGAVDRVFGEGEGGFSGWSKAKVGLNRRINDARAQAAKALGRRAAKPQPIANWRLHDLRRTVATVMADKLGVLPHVIEATLNHVGGHKAGVAGVYNRATYEAEKKMALVLWADHVRSIVEGGERKVVALSARAAAIK
jgi:integrase